MRNADINKPTSVFRFLYIFIFFCTLQSTACLEPGYQRFTMEYDGLERDYLVYIPESYNNEPVPVVFDLHPWITSAWIQELLSGMSAKAEEENFIVVQPNGSSVRFGLLGSWNAGPACCLPANDPDNPIDDVGFIAAILEELKNRVYVDESRVYADGMSNGGYLSHRLACEAADTFAAIGPVASSIGYGNINECQPIRPVPVWMFSGEEDNLNRKKETADYWAYEVNGCDDLPPMEVWQNGSVTCYRYQNCDGAPVEHCIGEGVGHCWPSPHVNVLPCTTDINVTDRMWGFFEENPLI